MGHCKTKGKNIVPAGIGEPCHYPAQASFVRELTAGRLERLLSYYPQAIAISARTGKGLDRLALAVSDALSREFVYLEVSMPISNGRLAAHLADEGEVLSRRYEDNRAIFHCRVPRRVLGRLEKEPDVTLHRLSVFE